MEREEKIKVAITAGIVAVILLILIIVLAVSGTKNDDESRLDNNISNYADSNAASEKSTDKADNSAAVLQSLEEASDSSSEALTGNPVENISGNSASDGSSTSDGGYSEYVNAPKNAVSGNSFYATKSAVLKDVYKNITFDKDSQMKEMFTYWNEGNLDAVRDLAHLERFEAMSYELSGTGDFYYYGEKSADGSPNGKGLAVYADDQYYFGNWADGKRDGEGSWISFYPNYSIYVVTEHSYTGHWSDDLPDGQGQEHYDYNSTYMNSEDIYLQNAIGGFAGGFYDGEMYIITVNMDGQTKEWIGSCSNGKWKQVSNASVDKSGRVPALNERENEDNHLYMTEKALSGNKVSSIISGGVKKD